MKNPKQTQFVQTKYPNLEGDRGISTTTNPGSPEDKGGEGEQHAGGRGRLASGSSCRSIIPVGEKQCVFKVL